MQKALSDLEKEILELYKNKYSSGDISKKLNISKDKGKRLIRKAGIVRTGSEAALLRKSPSVYIRTEEHKKRLSDLAKERTGNKNPFFGKTHTDEIKKRLIDSAKTRTSIRNPNYKTGEYQRRPRDFKQAEFTRLRNLIFNRDGHTCRISGIKGNHLHAHHLIPFWVCPEAFLDVENLITVSTNEHFKTCHEGNWIKFNVNIIPDSLLNKYNLHRERLNEMAGNKSPEVIVRPTAIYETVEIDRNVLSIEETQ
jgi:DNA-binding CsgD family transcriptional regulator